MDENDRTLAADKAHLKLLIDSSAYLSMQDIAVDTGFHPLNIIEENPSISYYFTDSVVNELMRGREGLNENTLNMMRRALRDESVSVKHGLKDNRVLYNAKDGTVRVAELNTISDVDHGQILLCQNHNDLVLVTSDHRMLKTAAALLDNRLMDVLNLLELMSDVPDKTYQKRWIIMREHYETHSGYKRPKTVRFIANRQPGAKPSHLRGGL